ncbi:MAG: CPBP family intramembrane glutamic endopeptidase [Balneola sp.]
MGNSNTVKRKFTSVWLKVLIALLAIYISMLIAIYLGEMVEPDFIISRYTLQALVLSSLIITSLWVLRNVVDHHLPRSIGIGHLSDGLKKFFLGLGLFLIPITLTITLTVVFGWGNVTFNSINLSVLGSGILTVMLFEALPEELIFRGYIYTHLTTDFAKWKASLITVLLFVISPVILVSIQRLLNINVTIGGASSITLSYILSLIFFGVFVQYLRVLTNSVWTGVGFHLFFVYINRLIGTSSENLIQLSDVTDETPMQIILGISMLAVLAGLFLYPKISKHKLGWKEKTELTAHPTE